MISVYNSIADDLALRGYSIADQFLSQEEVNAVLALNDFSKGSENFKKAGIGKQQTLQINESIRGDYIQWLDKKSVSPELTTYLSRLDELRQYLNQALFLSLKDFEIHLTIYPIGSFYKRHLDQFKKDDHRKLSVICYLNHHWEPEHGGELRIYHIEGSQDILPIAGRLVCFRSDALEHEVLPASRERLSLTGWMLDQFSDIPGL
ncbi:MAG: 2OG-Fe(II) oxygenase [Cyclobacteriaceae bacterium]